MTGVKGQIRLGTTLEIKVDKLKEWAQTTTNDPTKLLLYLNGTAMRGLELKLDQLNEDRLFFDLRRSNTTDEKVDNRKAWDTLFSQPKALGEDGTIRVTVGQETGLPFGSGSTARLYAIDPFWFWIYLGFLILLLIGIVKLARESNLLRDAGPVPVRAQKSYSLARAQMAFWFFLIVAAYVFIWMVTSATDTITASVLGLMGISAGTGLAAVVVDNSKRMQAKTELDKLRTEQVQLQALTPPPPEGGLRLTVLPGLIAAQEKLIEPSASGGFIHDILSDADGISFHRLQIAVWTVVLGFIFVVSVYNVLSMPTFSDTLLGLMGISGGTYVGFKLPEKLN